MMIRINNSEERDMFLSLLGEKIKIVDLYLSTKSGGLNIRLAGSRENVKLAISEIKYIRKQIKGLLYPHRGFYSYEMGFLFREAGASIRIETLQRLLKYKGYKIKSDSSTSGLIKSDAPLQVLVDLIRRVNTVIREIDILIKPKVIREQIAILSVLIDVDPFMILERALEEGLIRKEEKARYSFACSIDKFLRTFSSNLVKNESTLP